MVKLKSLLNESSKACRHRRNNLNIQITIFAWIVEFLGFLMAFLGTFILGHENSMTTLCLQTFTLTVYFIILPSTFLLNGSKLKDRIVDSSSYIEFSKLFMENPIEDNRFDQSSQNHEDNVSGQADVNEGNDEVSSHNEGRDLCRKNNSIECSQKENRASIAILEESDNANKISSKSCVLTEL